MDNNFLLTYKIEQCDNRIHHCFEWFETQNELIDFVGDKKIKDKSFEVIDSIKINDCENIELDQKGIDNMDERYKETSLSEFEDINDMLELCYNKIIKIKINTVTDWDKISFCHKIQRKCDKLNKLAEKTLN